MPLHRRPWPWFVAFVVIGVVALFFLNGAPAGAASLAAMLIFVRAAILAASRHEPESTDRVKSAGIIGS